MAFDFAQISVPYRMRPGLARLDPETIHLTPLRPGSTLHAAKLSAWRTGATRLALPGCDPSAAMAEIRAQALKAGVAQHDDKALPLELQVEEDLALLDTASGCVPWMCVCVPSNWAPEDKLGQSLASIHAPVADGAELAAALPHLLRVLSGGKHWVRFVWTLSPSAHHDQHPRRRPPPPWPDTADPQALAAQCYLRAERQTFIPVRDHHGRPTPQVVFTIRVMVQPLVEAVRSNSDARRLHDALASMSEAVLTYKRLTPARERLLRWLEHRAGGALSRADAQV